MLRKVSVRLTAVLLLCLTLTTRSQESATPEPKSPPKPRSARVTFLPPPLDGTISLGIFDPKGKLVRILHREADLNEFTVGADALSTLWDGKDDSGADAPAGKYRAHGLVVGDVRVDGVGFFFNDWITADDSPRISRIRSLALRDGKLLLGVDLVSHAAGYVVYDLAAKTITLGDGVPPESSVSTTPSSPSPSPSPDAAPESVDPVMTVPGSNNIRWVIDRTAKGAATTELKQFSASGQLLRRLSPAIDQPQPLAVAPSLVEDKIYLLEENSTVQRLRGLTFVAPKPEDGEQPGSEWQIDFEKSIIAHQDFSLSGGKPVASASGDANVPANVKVKLQPNPLLNDERVTVELAVGFGPDGSFLKTSDGLPLCSISETPGIIRALIASQGSNGVNVFQDDGAVVEQFRVTGMDQMMSFDCGGFELK